MSDETLRQRIINDLDLVLFYLLLSIIKLVNVSAMLKGFLGLWLRVGISLKEILFSIVAFYLGGCFSAFDLRDSFSLQSRVSEGSSLHAVSLLLE